MNITRDTLLQAGFEESTYFGGFFTMYTDDEYYITIEQQHSSNTVIDNMWHVRFFKVCDNIYTKICTMHTLQTIDEFNILCALLNIKL